MIKPLITFRTKSLRAYHNFTAFLLREGHGSGLGYNITPSIIGKTFYLTLLLTFDTLEDFLAFKTEIERIKARAKKHTNAYIDIINQDTDDAPTTNEN